jgi:hypothetical protein
MTSPRLWPNNEKERRDEAAVLANEVVKTLEPFLNPKPMAELDQRRRAAVALADCQEIMRLMQEAGSNVVLDGINPNPARWRFSTVSS